jgi:hypothetical protein
MKLIQLILRKLNTLAILGRLTDLAVIGTYSLILIGWSRQQRLI